MSTILTAYSIADLDGNLLLDVYVVNRSISSGGLIMR
jgi:hypothetical protein